MKQTEASEAPRARLNRRSESVKRTQDQRRAGVEAEWHPCLWCGAAIAERRVKDAKLRSQEPKYCGDECRRNAPARSLVRKIMVAAMGADKSDEALWRTVYDSRIEYAIAPVEIGGRRKRGAK
jgi:hypothetical protein